MTGWTAGRLGFSWLGALFLLALFLPNLFWAENKPAGYDPAGENRVLLALERAGQASVTCVVLIFRDFNWHAWTARCWWLIGAIVLMALYELWWVRYFRSERTLADFYRSLFGIPVAGAALPVAAFLLLGFYGRVVWLPPAAAVLGVGHIGIHLQHRRELSLRKEQANE